MDIEDQLRINIINNLISYLRIIEFQNIYKNVNINKIDILNNKLYLSIINWIKYHNINGYKQMKYCLFDDYITYYKRQYILYDIPINYDIIRKELYDLIIVEEINKKK